MPLSSDVPKTVLLRGDPIGGEAAQAASAAIKPGMLIELTSAGTVRKHATAEAKAAMMFAREADYAGGDIDTAFEDGENVPFWNARPGDWYYAWLATPNDVAIGELLESNGAGAFRKIGTTGTALVKALEAVDNDPGTGGAAVRLKVEVL